MYIYIYIRTYVRTYVYMFICKCTCVRRYLCMHLQDNMCSKSTCICMYIGLYTCTCTYVHACVHVQALVSNAFFTKSDVMCDSTHFSFLLAVRLGIVELRCNLLFQKLVSASIQKTLETFPWTFPAAIKHLASLA